jgi:hypothetical protein
MALLAALAGCASAGDSVGRSTGPAQTVSAPAEVPGIGNGVGVYLKTLRTLVEGDADMQAEIFRSVSATADAAPTTANRLMLGLVLATPTHPASDAAQAQGLLSELLAMNDALLPEEHVLALVVLKDVEQRLVLDAEANRLRRAAAAATSQRNDRSAQELQNALEENRQLRAALDEARARLDAITNIERSIRERENAPNPQ